MTMKPRMDRLFSAILLTGTLLWAAPGLAAARVPAGVDLIFLIDQSGSMTASGASGVANDRFGTRVEAIRQLEGVLEQSARAGYINRISVVEFGGRNARSEAFRPQVTLERVLLPALPQGNVRAKSQFDDQFDRIEQQVKPAYRGDTDIANALKLADEQVEWFAANTPPLLPGARVGERKQVIVLITDGAPYAAGVSPSQMDREVRQWAGTYPRDSDLLKFVVFGLEDQGSNYWDERWEDYWKSVASVDPQSEQGLAFKVDTSNPKDVRVAEKLAEVLNELIPPGVDGQPASYDTYSAPAYLKALRFTIDYASSPWLPEAAIKVLAPDGSRLPVREYGETAATIEIQDPLPGRYQLREANAPYKVHVLPIYAAARLTAPRGTLAQNARESLAYSLDGRGPGGLFKPQGNLPAVNFLVEVRAPDGTIQTVPLKPSQSPGEIVSDREVDFNQLGKYQLAMSGKTRAQDGSEQDIYRAEDWLDVTDATPVEAVFVAPGGDDRLGLLHGAGDLPVEVRFRNARTGVEAPLNQILAPGGELRISYFEAQAAGQPGAGAPLRVNGNALRADLRIDFGESRWDRLLRPGAIQLVLESDAVVWQDDVQYTGIAGSGDYSLGPSVPFTESWLILWKPIVSLLGLLVLVWLLWRWVALSWLIKSSDEKNRRNPRLIFQDPRHPENTMEWGLKGVRVITEPRRVTLRDGNTWSIEKFRIKRLRRPGKKVAVEVAYRPYGEQKGVLKRRLEAADDFASPKARLPIEGLPDDQAAEFLLFAGESDT